MLTSLAAWWNRLTASDRINLGLLLWTVVNAFIALKAARASERAANVAAGALRDQQEARKRAAAARVAERRSDYYRALVADPALESIPIFRRNALSLTTASAKEIAALEATRPKTDFDVIVVATTEKFNTLFGQIEDQLLARARASKDDHLVTALGAALTQLQDGTTKQLKHLSGDTDAAPELISIIDSGCAQLTAIIVQRDLDRFAKDTAEHEAAVPADPSQLTLPLPAETISRGDTATRENALRFRGG